MFKTTSQTMTTQGLCILVLQTINSPKQSVECHDMFSEEYVKWMLTIHNFTKKRHHVMFGNHLVHTWETDGVEISSYCDELLSPETETRGEANNRFIVLSD